MGKSSHKNTEVKDENKNKEDGKDQIDEEKFNVKEIIGYYKRRNNSKVMWHLKVDNSWNFLPPTFRK